MLVVCCIVCVFHTCCVPAACGSHACCRPAAPLSHGYGPHVSHVSASMPSQVQTDLYMRLYSHLHRTAMPQCLQSKNSHALLYARPHTCPLTCPHTHPCARLHMSTHTPTRTSTHMSTHTSMHMPARTSARTSTGIRALHACTWARLSFEQSVPRASPHVRRQARRTCATPRGAVWASVGAAR